MKHYQDFTSEDFGRGFYSYSNTIIVPATVRHIIGTGSVLRSPVDLAGKPLFRFEGGTEPVVLERFELNARNGYLVEHASPRTVVMQSIGSFDEGFAYRNQPGAGKLFVNDVSAKGWQINHPQLVWARQFNPEGNATYVTNTGGTLWVLGFKTENSETIFETRRGGSTEALGGFTYTFGDRGKPALINNGSRVSASFGGTSYVANGAYGTLVRETSSTTTTTIAGSSAYGGRTYSVPMYVGILDAPPPGGGSGTGTGLTGQYFDNQDLTNLRLTRVDLTINFDWGTGSPGRKIGPDSFSARWTGQVQPRYSETYTFSITSDNGRLWVNDQLVIDQWINDQGITYSGTIALLAGQQYNIRIEYFEGLGGANIKLEWNSPAQVREVVPQSQLYPTAAARIAAETRAGQPELQLRASPNPTSGETVISFTPTRDEAVGLHLYDAQGRLVKCVFEGVVETGTPQRHVVEGQALKTGLYYIRLNTTTGTAARKLLIAR